jgi:chemotaxis protein CheX
MKVDYVNPILESIQDVFNMMVGITLQPGKPILKTDKTPLGVVSGIVEMNGDHINGSLAISFEKAIILQVTENLLDEKHREIDLTVRDCVGELTNMICGGSKTRLAKKGYEFKMSIPSVLVDPAHIVDHNIKAPTILLPFNTEYGDVAVEFCFRESRKAKLPTPKSSANSRK